MGVNHGGTSPPQNYEWGTLMQIVPRLDFKKNITAQNSQKYAISSEKFSFAGMGLARLAPQTPPSVDLTPRPNQAFWMRLCVAPEFQLDLRLWQQFGPGDGRRTGTLKQGRVWRLL